MNNVENKEIRCFTADVEVRATGTEGEAKGNKLTGYAVKFNDITTIGNQFEERVANTAFSGVDMTNTLALWNHNYDEPVGRAGKNLNLSIDSKGLRFDIDLPNTTRGNDIAELVRTGIVGGMSFGFTIADDEWEQRDGMPLRTINEVDSLYEITFTAIPAYPTTEIAMRSLEAASVEVEVPVEEVTTNDAAEEVAETAPAVEEAPEAVAETTDEVVEAPSAEETVESQPGITKKELEDYLLSLLK